MKAKTIIKALAFAMLMPALLFTAACNSDFINDEGTDQKGFALPVTIKVTRENTSTKATFNDDTKKLSFSAGDKLFVGGNYDDWDKRFAGTLDYDAESGKFSGTIYTQDDTYKTYEDLFGNSDYTIATLLPAGYKDHGYLVINPNDPDVQYDDYIEDSNEYTLATSKADGVAQFSYEKSYSYNDGFALSPENAILNFTITGLAASTSINVSLTSIAYNITGTVTTDASGTATFAAGIMGGLNLQPFSLTVGGKNITLVSSDKVVEEGHIYNINRSAGPAATDLSTINANYTASDGETLTGTLASNVKISIADGATVTLNNVNINGSGTWTSGNYAGITCEGDATIILSGTNSVKGFYENYPGIHIATGKTLIIKGSGTLTASTNNGDGGAGIGAGRQIHCGNIEIQNGTITANGGQNGAGIGGGFLANCGNITISGGTVMATGGYKAAGIGGGRGNNNNYKSSCGTITITTGVTKVTATKGDGADNSIGAGKYCTCGTVTIGGNVGAITTSPYTYQPE